jgi:Cupin-like domain
MSLVATRVAAVPESFQSGVLQADDGEFQQKFNHQPFIFNHDLAHHPLFSIPRLAAVAQKMLEFGNPKNVTTRVGKSSLADAKFSAMPMKERLAETVRQIAEANVWLKLSSAHLVDEEYNDLLKSVLREVESKAGQPLLNKITWSAMTIFLTSPRVLTPYHIDHESNFLMQVRGTKQVNLFDPNDRELVPLEQIERFYAGDFEAAQYRPDLQSRGTVYNLVPGTVVHQPPLAPHWVQNGDEVSISVSIGFCLEPLDRVARVHQVNHFIRRFGFEPTPPGKSVLLDGFKKAGIGLVSKKNPSTPGEILFSGLTRLSKPPRTVKKWVRALRGSATRPA